MYSTNIQRKPKGWEIRWMIPLAIATLFAGFVTPSASAAQDSDDSCTTYLVPLIQQAGLDVQISAPSLGCRQDELRRWYMPRISEISDDSAYNELGSQGLLLLDAVDRMSTDPAFASSLRFIRHEAAVEVPGRGGVVDSIDVSDNGIGVAPSWLHNLQNVYSQSMQTYLTRTAGQEADLVYYVQWFMARRDVTVSTLSLHLNPMAANAFLLNWGYQQFPWPWQLADPSAIAAYTGSTALDASSADAPMPSPTSSATSTSVSASRENPSQSTDGGPIFSPSPLTVVPGENVDITVSLPSTDFGGGFVLTVTLPAGIELMNIPRCTPSAACEGAALETDVSQSQGGSTAVEVSGLLMDRDNSASFNLTIRISEQAVAEDSFLVTADLGFMSRSAPSNSPEESVLEVVVESPDALPRAARDHSDGS